MPPRIHHITAPKTNWAPPRHDAIDDDERPYVAYRARTTAARSCAAQRGSARTGSNQNIDIVETQNISSFTMRISVILLLALSLSLVAGTFAVTGSYYTDSACNNSVASPFNGISQPIVASVNQCFLAFKNGSTVYGKATFCNSTFSTFENFNDAGCTVKTGSFEYVPSTCFSDRSKYSFPNNAAAGMVTCADPNTPAITPAPAASIAVSTSVAALAALALVLI
jgi:hypothetical protein